MFYTWIRREERDDRKRDGWEDEKLMKGAKEGEREREREHGMMVS